MIIITISCKVLILNAICKVGTWCKYVWCVLFCQTSHSELRTCNLWVWIQFDWRFCYSNKVCSLVTCQLSVLAWVDDQEELSYYMFITSRYLSAYWRIASDRWSPKGSKGSLSVYRSHQSSQLYNHFQSRFRARPDPL